MKPGELWSWKHITSKQLANPALWLLASLGVMLIALTIVFVFLPLFFRLSDLRGTGLLGRRLIGLSYFAAIGFGFMVVEIALIQRLSLFLGHPSYSLIVVLFAILIGTAIGARATRRLTAHGLSSLAGGIIVAVLSIAAALFLSDVLRSLITMPLPGRMALAAAVVFVFGLVMGVMLPLGITLVGHQDHAIVPWAWGINGGTSVIGTVGATIIAINAGFTATFLVGAILYIGAGGTGFWLSRRA